MRSLEQIRDLLPQLRADLLAQQHHTADGYHDEGHLEIEDAASALEEAEGHLAMALSKIDHFHEMNTPRRPGRDPDTLRDDAWLASR